MNNKFSAKDQIFFAKRLSFLLKAGVPISESLGLIAKQSKKPKQSRLLYNVQSNVTEGHFLSSALRRLGGVFTEFAVNIIEVGEQGGVLGENLHYLAEEMKKRRILQKKIVGALIYPLFIALATVGISLSLALLVFPKVVPIFSQMGGSLPFTTRLLMWSSLTLINYGWLLIIVFTVFVIGLFFLYNRPKVKYFLHKILILIPVFGSLLKYYYLANFCRTMGLLLKHDSKIEAALNVSAKTCASLVYKNYFIDMAKMVKAGERISGYVKGRENFFPEMFGPMLAVGETTGDLSETFLYLAQNYEQEADDLSKNFSNLLEPFLMVFMGLLVGFVAMSIILPIYSITQKLKI